MEVQGKVKLIGEVKTFGESFNKREIVLTTNDQYPQMIMIELHQDKCDLINNYKVGDDVKVSINLRGKEWVNPEGVARYFNSLVGWRIESTAKQNTPVDTTMKSVNELEKSIANDEPDDLPF